MTPVAQASAPGLERYDGALRLRVADGRIDGLRQTPPMRLFRPYPELGEPRTVVVGNVAGGVVGGDRLAVDVAVGPGESLLGPGVHRQCVRVPAIFNQVVHLGVRG